MCASWAFNSLFEVKQRKLVTCKHKKIEITGFQASWKLRKTPKACTSNASLRSHSLWCLNVRFNIRCVICPYAPIRSASLGVGFGYLNTFSHGIWSTRDESICKESIRFHLHIRPEPPSSFEKLCFQSASVDEAVEIHQSNSFSCQGNNSVNHISVHWVIRLHFIQNTRQGHDLNNMSSRCRQRTLTDVFWLLSKIWLSLLR